MSTPTPAEGARHTPGPWGDASSKADVQNSERIVAADDRSANGEHVIAPCYGSAREANAQLIASAPALLAEVAALKAEIAELNGRPLITPDHFERGVFIRNLREMAAEIKALKAKQAELRAALRVYAHAGNAAARALARVERSQP